jgi:hypothetical protein
MPTAHKVSDLLIEELTSYLLFSYTINTESTRNKRQQHKFESKGETREVFWEFHNPEHTN